MPPTSFIGRRSELARLRRFVAADRLVTIVGPAGAGKTRLALELARGAAARGRTVGFAELAATSDPLRVSGAVAAALRIPTDVPLTPREVAERLRERELLLVLDNCEHVRAASAEVAAAVIGSCPHVRIVATSREPLGVAGERTWPVPPLSLGSEDTASLDAKGWERSDAVRLFAERARLAQPRFAVDEGTGPILVELCRDLHGVPLAIEMAAARLRHISLEEVRAHLGDQLRLLTDVSRGADERQSTMRAAIDWSHDLLGEDEHRVFRRLAVFSGSFALDAAEAVCVDDRIGPTDVLPAVASLVDRSLLRADTASIPARYSLLEVLRQYARERLVAAGEAALVEERRARFVVRLALEFDPDRPSGPGQDVHRFVADHGNVRGAVAWLFEHDPDAVRPILAQAWVVYIFLGTGVDQTEIEEWLTRGLADPTRDSFRARMLLALSQRRSLHDPAGAAAAAQEAREIATETGDEKARGGALYRLGLLRLAQGDRRGALDRFGSAIDALDTPSPNVAAWVRAHRGQTRGEIGDLAGAAADFAAALAFCDRNPGRRRLRAIVRSFQGRHELSVGRHAAAAATFAEVVQTYREIGSEVPVARALEGLAVIAASRGEPDRALRLAGATEAIRERGGDTLPRLSSDRDALDAVARGVGERAKRLHEEGRRMTTDRAIAYALETRARSGGEGLTAREREVAALVARGRTNREIARQLSLSERTVENHVERILTRLDLRTRSQVARWVSERGLAT